MFHRSHDGRPGEINVRPAAHGVGLADSRVSKGVLTISGLAIPPSMRSAALTRRPQDHPHRPLHHGGVAEVACATTVTSPQWPGGPTATSEVRGRDSNPPNPPSPPHVHTLSRAPWLPRVAGLQPVHLLARPGAPRCPPQVHLADGRSRRRAAPYLRVCSRAWVRAMVSVCVGTSRCVGVDV